MKHPLTYFTSAMMAILLLAACTVPMPPAPPAPVSDNKSDNKIVGPTPSEPSPALDASSAAQEGELPGFEPTEECFVEIAEGIAYDCGYVIVPEFHDNRSDNTLSLGVVRLRSTATQPASPIFFGAGGPGGSVLEWVPSTTSDISFDPSGAYGQILATRDLVYFAQRGTQNAEPFLNCPEEKAAEEEMARPRTFDEHLRVEIEVLRTCHTRLVDEGVNLDAFNSLENAADIDTIRQALGYDQIVYYGESYGTILGQHLMREFPDILEAVILDGTTSLSTTYWEEDSVRKYQIVLDRIVELCDASPQCRDAYPDFAENLEAIYQQAQTDPLQVTLTTSGGTTLDVLVDGSVLASTMYTNLYLTDNIAKYPRTVQEMLAGDVSTFQQFFSLANSAFSDTGTMMHAAVVCSEDPVASDDSLNEPEGDVYAMALEHAREGVASYSEICDLVNVSPIDETDENVSSELPVLILSGALDPATPNFRSDEVAETLPNSFTFLFPYGSHVQLDPASNCAVKIMAQFVADPFSQPDGSCIDTLPPMVFTLPDLKLADIFDIPFSLTQAYIDGEFPALDEDAPFTLTISDTGITIQADCNTVNASYVEDEQGNLLIDLGASTLVECGPTSIADDVLAVLQGADLTILLNTPEGKINLGFIAGEIGNSVTFSN